MKELEVTLRLRNNLLKERRKALGMNQRAFAEAAGVGLCTYRELEALRQSPRTRGGDWREVALVLARFHCVEPEALFPPAVLGIEQPVAVRKLDGAELRRQLTSQQQPAIESPDALHDRAELRAVIARALDDLCPRQAEVLRRRFGMDEGEPATLEEISEALDLSRERVRQIELVALRRLRRGQLRTNVLRAFLPESGDE